MSDLTPERIRDAVATINLTWPGCREGSAAYTVTRGLTLHADDMERAWAQVRAVQGLPSKPYPSGEARKPIAFLVQCVVCPQRALVDEQPEGDWTCPRCAEVTGGFGDVDVLAAERPDERQNRLIRDVLTAATPDVPDHYPIEKVRG